MKVIVTGAKGTVGRALVQQLKDQRHEVVAWDRQAVSISDYDQMETFVLLHQPDVIYHLAICSAPTGLDNEGWLVNYHWPSELAWLCRIHKIDFIYTSTAMVFSNNAKGPFSLSSDPDACEGYGYEKRQAELRVFYQNPNAKVVRLGWQIGSELGSNNMFNFLAQQMKEKGYIEASQQWLPACSLLPVTAKVLIELTQLESGLYMLDSNKRWTFYQIVSAINAHYQQQWDVRATDDFVYDQRMQDDILNVELLECGLPELEKLFPKA